MTLHQFFLYSAVGGGALFLVQIALSMFGVGDADVDFGGSHPDTGQTSADTAFKVLSIQGLTAFFTMLGLVGLALLDESHQSGTVALFGGVLGGALSTYIIARIFRAARSLESTGNLDLSKAVGQVGTVYLRIAPNKPGKVTVSVDGRLMTLDATTSAEAFDTGSEVRIERAMPDGSLVVSKP